MILIIKLSPLGGAQIKTRSPGIIFLPIVSLLCVERFFPVGGHKGPPHRIVHQQKTYKNGGSAFAVPPVSLSAGRPRNASPILT
jgi:hypothetical protein